MKAAVLHEFGTPVYEDHAEPPASAGTRVRVCAAGLTHLDLLRSSGDHYSGIPVLPSVAGTEGVGVLADGRRVYFDRTVQPYGSMAETAVITGDGLAPVHDDMDDIAAVAIGNSGVTALLALRDSAKLQRGETVLVLGATGSVGLLAVQIAKLLGAGRVVAAGRNVAALERARNAGADATVRLGDDHDETVDELRAAGSPNVTLDLLWAEPGLAALEAAAPNARHVEVGHAAGEFMRLRAMTLRGLPATIVGHSNIRIPAPVRADAYGELGDHYAAGRLVVDAVGMPLAQVAEAWAELLRGTNRKLVLIP